MWRAHFRRATHHKGPSLLQRHKPEGGEELWSWTYIMCLAKGSLALLNGTIVPTVLLSQGDRSSSTYNCSANETKKPKQQCKAAGKVVSFKKLHLLNDIIEQWRTFSPTDFWQPSKYDYRGALSPTKLGLSRAWAGAVLCPSNSQLLEEAPGQWAAGSNLQQIEPSLFLQLRKTWINHHYPFIHQSIIVSIKAHPFCPLKFFLHMPLFAHGTFCDNFLQP